ncbi:esterase-like activity of phytase family protein [Vibrio sp. SCSIO 43132]|uniref:esterase-like activity of phytase family protein n=1 Tax=Vibrio sp. SCSIO 43132 TaxID=2779363 RepID=UPI001CAA2CC2|nr:esterase-like activity of phytase family protein [Vibrio sp. SCSIO 43132]UAB71638.1 esterase-like activity of phytase family protein [Vibrio sp. SCSIO 43132]
MMNSKYLWAMMPLLSLSAFAETQFEAKLKGHVIIPAQSFIVPPKDAPYSFSHSGRFTGKGNQRVEQTGANKNKTGIGTPFAGQPLQGFSGIKTLGDDRFLLLTDNGFGRKSNSADAMLFFHIAKIDFENDEALIEKTLFLSDPNRVVPFPIQTEHSETRYLTGADFDPESIQPIEGGYIIGEEFGPYILTTDSDGVVTSFHETRVNGHLYRSPDNPMADFTSGKDKFDVPRSGGYEGMAASPDGRFVYPMLEKPTIGEKSGLRYLKVFEFDVAKRAFTSNVYKYPLHENAPAIGDFNLIDDRRALVIERDNGQGDEDKSCKVSAKPCFSNPAKFKRIYLVDLKAKDANGLAKKLGYIDLMDIQDPDKLAKLGARKDGRFTFPFVTIEDVDRFDDNHIIVGNDNNFPFSQGRHPVNADNNEFILLEVGPFLKQK